MMRWRTTEGSPTSAANDESKFASLKMTAGTLLDADDLVTSSSADDALHLDQRQQEAAHDDDMESSLLHEEKKFDKQNVDLPDNNDLDDIKSSSSNGGRVIVDDDDGADHAEEPSTPWSPQNVQSTCEFTHTIKDYSQKRESGCKKAEYSSTTVDEFGNRWRLIVYVNGNGRASNHHLSLFLQVADADDLPFGWKKAVSYVLTLEHPKGPSLSYAKRNPDKTFKLCPKAIDWGWSQFITSDRIQQEGFVCDDSLTVRASVTVKSSSVSIDEEDAELYLKCAVEEGDVEAVKLCLEHGASVNCKFKDDLYTPLHTACSSGTNMGSMEVLNLLLDEGADGNACNKWKETPLLIAANNGHRTAVEALLKHGANPSLCSEAGWSALTFAAHKGYDDIVALLLRAGAPVNCPVTEDSSTPLHKACAGSKPGHLACVKLLLEAGADVHALNKWRETPLLTAANHGQAGAVDALLQAGADPCKCTDTGWSPLSIAAYKGHDDVVRLLLEEGAPTEEDDPTLSALLQAATKGLPDTVELLLRHGADHTVTTKKGDTALSILVEQNLIDAAVEMVTEYNANIPRCSRDRKKVQRARLLINLRMKQLEREGKLKTNTDDAETDEEEESKSAQHEEISPKEEDHVTTKNLKRKKNSHKLSAEEQARAAEEALLLELEQEENKAKKEKAEANSKRQKKKEKKERERQQKLKEEQARREKEEQERIEREQMRREKEDKERKEKERKLMEQQEREKRELLEREKALAARRREREEREQREREKEQRESEQKEREQRAKEHSKKVAISVSTAAVNGPDRRAKGSRQKKSPTTSQPRNNGVSPKQAKAASAVIGNRRWETRVKPKSPSGANAQRRVAPAPAYSGQGTALPQSNSSAPQSPASDSLPQTLLSPRVSSSAWKVEQPSYRLTSEFSMPKKSDDDIITESIGFQSKILGMSIEHPAIALFRREKVAEMIAWCTQVLAVVDGTLVKRILYRWTVRAAHDASPLVDPLIPSWTNTEQMVAFFQRQLISESRRNGVMSASMEVLKEAGTSIAMFCMNLAREIDQFRRRIEEHLPDDWTDSALGMTVSDGSLDRTGATVTLSWANRAQVFIPSATFQSLRDRHVGPPSRFLASCFMAKMFYDTRRLIVGGTTMDFRFSSKTKNCVKAVAGVSAELWSDLFSSENVFWGMLESVDALFGGQQPFGKDQRCEEILASHGGSFLVFMPMDAAVAANYMQRMLDIIGRTQNTGIPVTFFIVAHADCFHDLPNGMSANDLKYLDPRLHAEYQSSVRFVETLLGGQHAFCHGDGVGESRICSTPSLFVVVQNDAGKTQCDINTPAMSRILSTISFPPQLENPIVTPMSLRNEYRTTELPVPSHASYFDGLPPISPDPQRIARPDFGAIGGPAIPQPFSPASDPVVRSSRRGRLFDLVDNGEDDDVDIVAGMLNSLDVGLFQNNNVGTEVDIEAISLMGIGSHPPHSIQPGTSHHGRFS